MQRATIRCTLLRPHVLAATSPQEDRLALRTAEDLALPTTLLMAFQGSLWMPKQHFMLPLPFPVSQSKRDETGSSLVWPKCIGEN